MSLVPPPEKNSSSNSQFLGSIRDKARGRPWCLLFSRSLRSRISSAPQAFCVEPTLEKKQSTSSLYHGRSLPVASSKRGDYSTAESSFLSEYPEYKLTSVLDSLRKSDYVRLDRAEQTYVDFVGGTLYPETLVRMHSVFLQQSVLGNTHSASNSSKMSTDCANEARKAVCNFFGANTEEYCVIFTANASGALKLVGESYPFAEGDSFVLGTDSHNSVNGIRQFAAAAGSNVVYMQSSSDGGIEIDGAKSTLLSCQPKDSHNSLLAITGASNVTNSKAPLSILKYASDLGYHTLLDAAALAPTTSISLTDLHVDAMAVSFYKMFGYPTGVGALVARKSFLEKLRRPWFAGGTVDVVQVPGTVITRAASEAHERFEDGTINYLDLSAVTNGLAFLSNYLPHLPLRLSCLTHYLVEALSQIRHETTAKPLVKITSRLPTKRLQKVGEQSDTGSTVSFVCYSSDGEMIPLSLIEYAASCSNISLRTGCMCNPGAAASMLGMQREMEALHEGITLKEFQDVVGRELGVVRVSLGLGSNFHDAWRVVQFMKDVIGSEKALRDIQDRLEIVDQK